MRQRWNNSFYAYNGTQVNVKAILHSMLSWFSKYIKLHCIKRFEQIAFYSVRVYIFFYNKLNIIMSMFLFFVVVYYYSCTIELSLNSVNNSERLESVLF